MFSPTSGGGESRRQGSRRLHACIMVGPHGAAKQYPVHASAPTDALRATQPRFSSHFACRGQKGQEFDTVAATPRQSLVRSINMRFAALQPPQRRGCSWLGGLACACTARDEFVQQCGMSLMCTTSGEKEIDNGSRCPARASWVASFGVCVRGV